jgi:tripartite-type tricarboxylate transporter receptor subunit TctC
MFTGGGSVSRFCVFLGVFFFSTSLWAQQFPSKALRVLVPFPAGGTTDIVARLVAQRMSEQMGQPVLVENRAGAGGTIAAAEVARSAPDGYTMLIHNVTFPIASVAAALANRATYNVDADFAGVSIAVYVPFVWTAHPGVPGANLAETMKVLQRDRSLRYTYGSTGPGSTMHILGEALSREARVEMTHIPFKGAAPLKQELIAGRVNIGGDQLSSSLGDIKAGKLKALATSASRRITELPDVPTVRELGYPILELDGWNGFFAPAKTPREVLDRLQREVAAAVKHPDISKRLLDMGAEPVGSSGAEQEAILKRQMDQFRPVIREVKVD